MRVSLSAGMHLNCYKCLRVNLKIVLIVNINIFHKFTTSNMSTLSCRYIIGIIIIFNINIVGTNSKFNI